MASKTTGAAGTTSLSGSDARRAARNISALMVASVISKGALFVWQLLLSLWLGPGEYGIYGTIGGLMASAAALASFSMGLIVIRDVARAPEKAGNYWTAMLFAQTLLALLAYVGMNSLSLGYSEALRAFAALAGLNLFVDIFGNMAYDLLLARERMVMTSTVEITHIFLRIGLALLALSLGWGLLGVYAAALVSGILRSLVLVSLNIRDGIKPQFPLDRALARRLLINSAPLALSALLTLVYQHADKLLTTGILGEEITGYLVVAFVINYGVIELISSSVLVAAYPLLARYYESGRNPIFGFLIGKLALYMLLVGLPVALSISILAEAIILPLLGETYAPSAGILRLLIWFTAITMFGNVFSKALLIQNRQRLLLAIRACGLAVNIALTLLLLFRWGDARGAVLASIVGELLIVALLLASFCALGWRARALAGVAARLLLICLPTALVMLALREAFILLPVLGGLGVYMGGVLALRVLGAEDWDLLYRLLTALPGGSQLGRIWKRDIQMSW
ncbi:MAG: oligosaccharide flippase family protein [Chloroflexi bacterium]|nr:oligosaccharide flippase family protein [Chloroflexota bacterium]